MALYRGRLDRSGERHERHREKAYLQNSARSVTQKDRHAVGIRDNGVEKAVFIEVAKVDARGDYSEEIQLKAQLETSLAIAQVHRGSRIGSLAESIRSDQIEVSIAVEVSEIRIGDVIIS